MRITPGDLRMNQGKWWIVTAVTVILILSILDYSHGAPNRHPPFISSVTPIRPLLNQRILIRGGGFGNSMPKLYHLRDSVDTVDIDGSGPSLAIRDYGSGPCNWTAGRVFRRDINMIGLKLESWSDSQIVLNGFGSALGGSWKMDVGDPLEIIVYRPNKSGIASFKTTVTPQALKKPKPPPILGNRKTVPTQASSKSQSITRKLLFYLMLAVGMLFLLVGFAVFGASLCFLPKALLILVFRRLSSMKTRIVLDRMIPVLRMMLVCCCLLALFLHSGNSTGSMKDFIISVFVLYGFCFTCIGIPYWTVKHIRKCPKCGARKWGGLWGGFFKEEEIGRREEMRTIQEQVLDHVEGPSNETDQGMSHAVYRTEIRHVWFEIIIYERFYRCSKCSHGWSEEFEETGRPLSR